ncbi:protogenin A-like [Planococcus citri]|uniref:protogenin A-like n=1 Tax=Planococcus citri TaxID=170843 RepID=UPI0031FA213C
MNYDRSLIITCEFMAVKGFLILLCATTIFVELSYADIQEPWMGKEILVQIKFLTEPKDVIVESGQTAKFSCDVSVIEGINSVSYTWMHNDRVYAGKKAKSGTLTISPAKKEKEGLYHCIANTTFGSLKSRAARLKIAEISSPSKDSIEPDVFASEGENVRLSCEINSVPEAEVMWFFEGNSISNRTEKYLISTKYLYINNTQKPDAGEYSCKGVNSMTKGQARLRFPLRVGEGVKIQEKKLAFISPEIPKNLTVVRGRNLSLHCHVNKANAFVTWLEVADIHHGGTMSRILLHQNSFYTLEFGQMEKENRYEYTCVAEIYKYDSNKKVTLEQIKQEVNITVGEAPKILGLSSSREMENLGIPKRFYCNVSGYPPPIVKWFHDGEEVDSNNKNHRFMITSNFESKEKISYNSLTVQDLEYRDRGVYQCVAENEFGSTSSATVLKIGSRDKIPPTVTGVKCHVINTTDIMVTFDPSGGHPNAPKVDVAEEIPLISTGDGGPSAPKITSTISAIFVVSFFREGDPTSRNAAPAINGSVIIGNLKPDSKYSFSVRRYQDRFGSDPSEKVSCSTSGSAIKIEEHAPKAQYLRLLPDSIFLYWPKFVDDSFEIHVQNMDNSSNKFRLTSYTNYTVITNLTVNEPYKISVYSIPSADAYEPIKIVLRQIELKYRFQIYKINESSVVLVWKLDATPVILKGYQIQYTRQGLEGDVNEAFVETDSSFFIIHGLSPGETYDASLFIVLDDGVNDHPTELTKLTFTMAQEPPEPRLPTITPDCGKAVDSELRFLWYYADPTFCIFLVKYRSLNSTEYKLRVSTEKNVKFYDVPADSGYEVSIQALNEDGEVSNFTTPPVTCKTKPAIPTVLTPGQVDNISYAQVSSKIAYLSWQRPKHFDPSKYSYVISYGIRNQTKPDWKPDSISAINTTEIRVHGDTNFVAIPELVANTEYVITIGVENILTHEISQGPKKIIVLQPRPEERDETFIGLVIGGSIGIVFILVCIISAICGKRLLKQYYYERNDSMRSLSTYKKPDMKILAKNSTVFKNSAAYGNGTNLQLPLLSNGTYVNGGVQITSIEGVRYCPGTGKKVTRHDDGMLLHRDSPLDDTYEKIMEAADTDRDREGGDSGYCDKTHSQSPPLKDSSGGRRHRKSSDIPTDDGFHESNEIYINGSSPV